ncbi:MAG: hypothetical protein KC517_09155 [Bacteroidetes bacterium]|nr:hypothetical protein [Bacteroidota bacterium]
MLPNDIYLGLPGLEYLLSSFGRVLTEGTEEITREGRTASGRKVKERTARKKKFNLAWSVIDQADLETLYTILELNSELSIQLRRPDSSVDTYTVLMQPFDHTRLLAVGNGLWADLSIDLEEV